MLINTLYNCFGLCRLKPGQICDLITRQLNIFLFHIGTTGGGGGGGGIKDFVLGTLSFNPFLREERTTSSRGRARFCN